MEKFIYVFSERDKNLLLEHGYILIKEPKKKRVPKKKVSEENQEENTKEELKIWIFANKLVKDMILDDLESYVFSNILTF